jgi:hypothetical protein
MEQLDPKHRLQFPAVLTARDALDRRVLTLMKPRTLGNSSSYIRQAITEVHSEEWARRCISYLTDCETYTRGLGAQGRLAENPSFEDPPAFRELPLAQWFQTAHSQEIYTHAAEMKARITGTFGKFLKIDSTKKVSVKKTFEYLFQVVSSGHEKDGRQGTRHGRMDDQCRE